MAHALGWAAGLNHRLSINNIPFYPIPLKKEKSVSAFSIDLPSLSFFFASPSTVVLPRCTTQYTTTTITTTY